MATFWEKYRDPKWQKRRLEILSLAEFKCVECGSGEKTLNVHHKLYRRGANPWDYADHELESLCEDCHEYKHDLKQELDAAIARMSAIEIQWLTGYAKGLYLRGGWDRNVTVEMHSMEEADGIADAFGITGPEVADVQGDHGILTADDVMEIRQRQLRERD